MRFTVLGGSGFIGSHLTRHLEQLGHEVLVPDKAGANLPDGSWGHVVYAIGLTGDFRHRPHETIEAHVTALSRLLQRAAFDSWLYLSSTRVYGATNDESPSTEDSRVEIHPSADSLYDLSKLLGEALCLAQPDDTIRVARLSNVFGAGLSDATFLGSILQELREKKEVTIHESPDSSKDYIAIEDVVEILQRIALSGRERLYNVASGCPTSHSTIAERINSIIGPRVSFALGAETRSFSAIDVSRVRSEFPEFRPVRIEDRLERLLEESDQKFGARNA